jgi:aryl-alcohol dehydrogenase-like predicted oxidoreductase
MKKVVLGQTGLEVYPLVFGTLPLGPLQAALSPEEGGRLIRHALERGVDFIDTAELYGTYAHIREGLRGFQGQVRIASKTHASTAELAREHVEKALKELGREYLDIVHLHAARLTDPFVERKEVWAELCEMKREGKVRHLGISSHRISVVRAAAENIEVEVIHPLINRTGMGILDGSAEQMAAAISRCSRSGKGIYAMKALAGGNLISEARGSLEYVRQKTGVNAVAVGMLNTREIDANIALFSGAVPDDALWKELEKRKRRLKIMEKFCSGCGTCVPACTNDALFIEGGKARLREEKCILCGYCAAACPDFLIRVV